MVPTIPEGDFFDCREDREQLFYEDLREALAGHLDDISEKGETLAETARREAPIEVFVFRRCSTPDPRGEAERLAELADEDWNEECGGPDGENEISLEKREALTKAIEAALVDFYRGEKPWTCEVVGQVLLDADQVLEVLGERHG